MENTKPQRNDWFDAIKFIASFFVVCIHISLIGGEFGVAVNAIARFAVPTFFAISGFYVLGADAATVKRRLFKVLRLYLFSSAIYHLYSIVIRIAEQGIVGLTDYLLNTFISAGNIKDFLIFNLPFSTVHLWYLLALMYVYLIWLVILKYSLSDKTVLIIGTLTLLANLVLGELLSVFNVDTEDHIVRNFAFTGLPFFIFGYLLRKYSYLFAKIKPVHLIFAIVIGSCEAVLSRFLIAHNEVFVGSVLCCFSIVILAEKLKTVKLSKKCVAVFRCSVDVYVFHMLFSDLLSPLVSNFPPICASVASALTPCWVFLVCIAFSLLKSYLTKKIKARIKKAQHSE